MTTSQTKIKLGEIKGLITQIKALSEAGGLNAVSMVEQAHQSPLAEQAFLNLSTRLQHWQKLKCKSWRKISSRRKPC
ncbi:hypothetical protein INT80_00285 [Gallibacterium anatis]|uniref:Uncharacterized protein n=1 Tax=Gallibacterium anatis TaxID=750 RepID=A0A930Y3C6_9PAST|nr:hypothetical protein [Gallibacterium anatis]